MTESLPKTGYDPLEVQVRIDQELIRHIHRLVGSDPLASTLPFSLSNIAILLLLVQRESEIQAFPESSTQRFTMDDCLGECTEIGLQAKEDLMASFQDLVSRGFVDKGHDQRYTPKARAMEMLDVLSRLFPGFSGVDLVAYMVQTIDEVTSRRKSLDDAINHFDQTLSHQESPIAEAGLLAEASDPLDDGDARAKLAAEEKKRTYLKRMAEIRSQESGNPAVVTLGGFSGPVNIRELFPRSETPQEIPPAGADTAAGPQVDPEPLIKPEIPEPRQHMEPETDARLAAPAPAETPTDSEPATGPAPIVPPEIQKPVLAPEAEDKDPGQRLTEPVLSAEGGSPEPVLPLPNISPSAPPDAPPPQIPPPEAESADRDILSEDAVESQIEALALSLSLSCPLCQSGSIKSNITQRGKQYYSCSNPACRFVSWGLPYHYPCPLCRNPFLIEYRASDGQPGLKCPRATCRFRQNHLGAPEDPHEKAGSPAPAPKKQKVVRRRVVRRRK